MRVLRRAYLLMAILLIGVGVQLPAVAQAVPTTKQGNLELGLFAGESYGLDRFRPMGGGNFAYGVSRYLYPFVEASYLPGILRTEDLPNSYSLRYNVNMTDFHGGIHFRVPLAERRVIPYGVAGLGLVRESQTTGYLTLPGFAGQSATSTSSIAAVTSFAVNFGAGLRFFITERFGLRLEFKAFKPVSASNLELTVNTPTPLQAHMFYRFAIGPYFQLR
jgi:opacity protein-like surface antigen